MQAGGQGALGGQVVLQGRDAQRGGQGVTLADQLPDPGGEGQLAAGVTAPPARGPLRPHRARGIQRAQERLPDPEDLGRLPGGVGRVVRVVQGVEAPVTAGAAGPGERGTKKLPSALDTFL
jgi:hypothetical protein